MKNAADQSLEIVCRPAYRLMQGWLRKIRFGVLVLLLGFASGCSTVATKASGKTWGEPYSGTRNALNLVSLGGVITAQAAQGTGRSVDKGDPLTPLIVRAPVMLAGTALSFAAAVDTPLSLVADTLVLPIDWAEKRRRNQVNAAGPTAPASAQHAYAPVPGSTPIQSAPLYTPPTLEQPVRESQSTEPGCGSQPARRQAAQWWQLPCR